MFLSLLDYYFCKMFKKPKVRNTSSLFRACQFPLCKRNGGSNTGGVGILTGVIGGKLDRTFHLDT